MSNTCGNLNANESLTESSSSHVSPLSQNLKKKKSRRRRAENQRQSFSNSFEQLSTITEENSPLVDAVLDDIPHVENRHSHQRCFNGLKQIPHTAPWIAQRIHEDKSSATIGILRAWTHTD
jgi:hypothetical protein